jgi:spectinomycin phosphotransferase
LLEKPDLQDTNIITCLLDEYGLNIIRVGFLPLGADRDTAVYRLVADDKTTYFLKLRRGDFDEISVALPKFLSDVGILQIIAPLAAKTGQLWANLDAFKTILYPFVEGCDGYEIALSDRQWVDFGTALKRIHTAVMPPGFIRRIRKETFSPQWREIVKTFLRRVEDGVFYDPAAVKLAGFLKVKHTEILDLVGRAERLAQALQVGPQEFVVCHSDIHAGNILIGTNGAVYIVDWDNPILAPKERDLMFIGGGQGFAGHTPQEEETLFYRGYGQTQVAPIALAYYRYERIIEDIAVFCEQILLTNDGGKDREQSLQYLKSNFLPNNTIDIAYQSDRTQGMW